MELSAELIANLKLIAAKEVSWDNYDVGAGYGSHDDSYNDGVNDGEIGLAREILKSLGIDYKA